MHLQHIVNGLCLSSDVTGTNKGQHINTQMPPSPSTFVMEKLICSMEYFAYKLATE